MAEYDYKDNDDGLGYINNDNDDIEGHNKHDINDHDNMNNNRNEECQTSTNKVTHI